MYRHSLTFIIFGYLLSSIVATTDTQSSVPSNSNGAISALSKVYAQCLDTDDMVKCFKIQALKFVSRAMKVQKINVIDGLSVIRKSDYRENRSFNDDQLNDGELKKLPSSKVENILLSNVDNLLQSHQLQVNVPRLISYGQQEVSRLIEEGRKKKNKYLGPLMAVMALKTGILKMAYHSIAIIAGKALIIGKIALVISAIIGLKKLVAPEGHEKTTYEIVKHPHVQQSHTYSSSGDYEGHESGGGQYHRSLGEEEMLMQDRIYRAQIPQS